MPHPAAAPTAFGSKFKELLPPLPAGHFYSQQAVLRAAAKANRVVAANSMVARQLKGQSVDDAWQETAKRLAGNEPRFVLQPPTSAASERRITLTPLRECWR